MEEVFETALVPDESESFVDEEACDSPGRHTRSPPFVPGSYVKAELESVESLGTFRG
jgi:hypothetical protein